MPQQQYDLVLSVAQFLPLLTLPMVRKRYSIYSIILIGIIYLASFHYYNPWKSGIVSGGDHWGYYLYLPAVFIHHDLDDMQTSVATRRLYHPGAVANTGNPLGVDELHYLQNGNQVNKYTMGVAILNIPAFLLAHLLAIIFDFPTDGYSPVYIYLIYLSGICYGLFGLLLLRKVLLKMTGETATAVTLAAMALATNLYFFAVAAGAMAHVYLFFLYALLIYATVNWYEKSKVKFAILVGLSCGFITLIRPSEMICLLIPVFWGITSLEAIRQRLNHIKIYWKGYGLSVLFFILAGLPQVIYWKWLTGKFIYYSYSNETFDFKHPHILEGLFSYQNGWLAYTPVMYLALIGILFLRDKGKAALMPVMLFLPLHIYITYSWWNWYYINGFGSRPMVETYALLSIPMAFFIRSAFSWHTFSKILVSGLLIFLAWLNVFNVYQFANGILWSENANWAYYKRVFGKTDLNYLDLVTYDTGETPPDEQKLTPVKKLYEDRFEDSVSARFMAKPVFAGKYSYVVDQSGEFSPGFQKTAGEADVRPGDWLRISVQCLRKHTGDDIYRMASLVFVIERPGEDPIKWTSIRLNNKPGNTSYTMWGGRPNTWGEAWFWTQIPENIKDSDILKVYAWNPTPKPIFIDDLKVEQYKKKQ